MFTTLSVMDTTGTLLAGPLVAMTFKFGVRIGGLWHGMPYLLSLGLCTIATCFMTRVTVEVEHRDENHEEEETTHLENDHV
jgi:hypothetical protein